MTLNQMQSSIFKMVAQIRVVAKEALVLERVVDIDAIDRYMRKYAPPVQAANIDQVTLVVASILSRLAPIDLNNLANNGIFKMNISLMQLAKKLRWG
jgi:ABC-type transport system involved in cytochrome bd biosynthesis fused ATPase/permease subunit